MSHLRLLQSGLSGPCCNYVLIVVCMKKGASLILKVTAPYRSYYFFFLKINVAAIHITTIPIDSINHSSKLIYLPPYPSHIKTSYLPIYTIMHHLSLKFYERKENDKRNLSMQFSCINRFLNDLCYFKERIIYFHNFSMAFLGTKPTDWLMT